MNFYEKCHGHLGLYAGKEDQGLLRVQYKLVYVPHAFASEN